MSPPAFAEIRREYGERRRDHKVVVAASRLQTEPALRARLEDELSEFPAQESRPGAFSATVRAPLRMAAPSRWISHDLPGSADTLRRAGERAIAAEQADANVRRRFRQKFCSGVAEAALIEDQEVEPGEVRRDQGELLAQRRLGQAQCSRDGEPVGLDVEEHEGAVRSDGRDQGRRQACQR